MAITLDIMATWQPAMLRAFLTRIRSSATLEPIAARLTQMVMEVGGNRLARPYSNALRVAAQFEALAANDDWQHPAAIVLKPRLRELIRFCDVRLQHSEGDEAERVVEIRRKIERAAELESRAAVRRGVKPRGKDSSWVREWIKPPPVAGAPAG